jgi:hypothetical protein
MAAIFGATTAVVLGGIGTLITVGVIAIIWPQVRNLREIRLEPEDVTPPVAEAATV